ncbi:MAG: branched chain amino acid aminotransferase [Candidatus Cloacimonadota bacterium]|nr:MAG: branched chain amino acid aminotransferase [Candidatus Cloacimonadota bacterium]
MHIEYTLKSNKRTEIFRPTEQLVFGKKRTDHMFLMDYDGESWQNARIVPYGNLSIAPGAVVLHYGQEIFEGCKSFKHDDGEIYGFRWDENAKRLNESAKIMIMPEIDVDIQLQAMHALMDLERLWFPEQKGASMYLRPFMFGTSDSLGVKPSKTYTYCIFLSPSGPYYKAGFSDPIRLLITSRFHRAVSGGSGAAKTGGNYGCSMRSIEFAHKFEASQVLYLDSNNMFLEEAGAMNHFHVTKNNEVIIPHFTDTILKSITSCSMLDLNLDGITVRQEFIGFKHFINGIENGDIVECGGFGTAAGVSPVGSYILESGKEYIVGNGKIGPVTQKLYDTLTGIQTGTIKAPEGWIQKV